MVYNFNSGPSILPKEVFEQAAEAVINFNNTALSILEIGHRTEIFKQVMEEARSLVKELMNLDDNKEVLFLHGGASTQFMQVPYNLLDKKKTASYTDTGIWANKAANEAQLFGKVEVVCSSKDKNYSFIPKDFVVPNDAVYIHFTSNNTVYGTQWQSFPKLSVPMVADMSSDILSRDINYNDFALIYAGAQKNIGAAGVNLVVVDKNILGKTKNKIPTILNYQKHIDAESMLNTPPVFAVYVCLLTLRWIKKMGGVAYFEKLNTEKANLLYSQIDESQIFEGSVAVEDRSKMNVCFRAKDSAAEEHFLNFCKKHNIVGIKGYRTVGGFRASLYNAMPLSSVQYLVDVMKEFELSWNK